MNITIRLDSRGPFYRWPTTWVISGGRVIRWLRFGIVIDWLKEKP